MTGSTLNDSSRVVVVGGSASGLTAVEELRRSGFAGSVSVVETEDAPPYDRPPLSKQIVAGEWEPERLELRDADALSALDVDWRLGVTATGLDTVAREIGLSDGSSLDYDGLVIATGVRPRPLPGCALRGVHMLRTIGDALALRDDLRKAQSVAVVGAGFLGAEVAAVARKMGRTVTMVDPAPYPMGIALGPEMGAMLARLHRENGVALRCGTGARDIIGAQGAVCAVVLGDGTEVAADVVLVAIGSLPNVDWLKDTQLDTTNGVLCDEFCFAAPNVVAAGDIARWTHPRFGSMRVEHRLNATEQGMAAAGTLLGRRTPFAPVPYFWSDQYDTKIQAFGVTGGDRKFSIVRGDPEDGRFGAVYVEDGRVAGCLAWNSVRVARELRAFVIAGADLAAVGYQALPAARQHAKA